MSEDTTLPLETRVANLEKYLSNIHQMVFDSSFKEEVFRRLFIEKDNSLYELYVSGLSRYSKFIETVKTITNTPKIVDKIKLIHEYNSNSLNLFTMWVDDVDIYSIIAEVGELSSNTYKLILELPHTKMIEEKLKQFLEPDKSTVN